MASNMPLLTLLALTLLGFALGYVMARWRGRDEAAALQAGQRQAEAAIAAERLRFAAREATLTAELAAAHAQADGLQGQCDGLADELAMLRQSLGSAQVALAEARLRAEEEHKATAARMQGITEARATLAAELQQLSERLFEEKSAKLAEGSQQLMEGLLSPLREQLGEFKRKVEDVYDKETRDRTLLHGEILQLKQLNQTINQQALSLTQALKGNSKTRGSWGEVILARVLEASGLREGHEYFTQRSITGADGRRRQPDVIVRLPENRDVIIDSKVALTDYERMCAAEDEAARAQSLRAHVAALRGHILGLSAKEYESLPGLRTLDFVLVFVPVEAAFLAALEAEPELFGEAYNRNIIVVSPSTLLATLRTIEGIWRYERQSQNAEEIARQGGLLFDQVVRTVESLDELGRSLERAQAAYHETLKRCATGRGNLLRRTQELGRLGAKGRKPIPESMLDRMEEDAELAAEVAESVDEPTVAAHVLPPASVPGEAA